jgi:hypothetical protein
MKFTYIRYWGAFTNDDNSYIGPGYSGHPDVLNNLTAQDRVGYGPIPAGEYTITEIRADDPHTGRISCLLEPAPENKMYGRSGFRIHGDNPEGNHTASDGCIISPHLVRIQFKVGDVITVV